MEVQQTLSSVLLKREYQTHGVVINRYHTDNGIFNTSEFMDKLLKKQQHISFSVDGASHKNGIEECTLKMVVAMTRTMMMHAALIFPNDTLSNYFIQC